MLPKMKTILLIIFTFSILFGCTQKQDQYKPLIIGTNLWPGYEPLYFAVDKKWITHDLAMISEFTSASLVSRAFEDGGLDVAAMTLDEAIRLNEKIPLTIILITDISNGADAIMGNSKIKSMQDLKGKKIGYEESALGSFFLRRALEKSNMKIEDVIPVNVELDRHLEFFKNNKIDAIVTFEPIKSKLLDLGAIKIFDSSEIPNEILDVLVVRTEKLSEIKEQVDMLIEKWFYAIDYIKKSETEAASFIAHRLGIKTTEVIQSFRELKYPNKVQNTQVLTLGISSIAKEIGDYLINYKIIKKFNSLSYYINKTQ